MKHENMHGQMSLMDPMPTEETKKTGNTAKKATLESGKMAGWLDGTEEFLT